MEKEKTIFYKSNWFMWICLILLPPIGIILLWLFHKDTKKTTRIILTILFVLWFIICIAFTFDNSDMSAVPDTTAHQTNTDTTNKTIVPDTITNKEINKISFNVRSVRNDVTGNWRIATIAENIQIQDYALDYYKEYFQSDKEIHAIVNITLKTTTKLSVIGDSIYVTIHEYVDKEEHDAKILFSGMVLKEYIIDMKSGKVEELR